MNHQYRPALGFACAVVGLALCLPIQTARAQEASAESSGHSTNSLEDNVGAGESLQGVIGPRSLLAVMRDGGPMLVSIGVCSIILFIFVFERSISLRRGRVIPQPFVKRFLLQLEEQQLKPEEALDLCEESASGVALVFGSAVKKWGRPSVEVEQAVIDTGERVANGLRKYLRLFNGIATISPLLGLLGTVLGMISAFNAIATADAMGRPELLAAGISQALLTTASGLTVAIPAIVAHLYFAGRVDRLIIEIDRLGQDVVNAIASDGWKKPSDKRRRTDRKAA